MRIWKKYSGFTLIELLVLIAIMELMVGGGIAAFRRFNDKQRVISAGKEYVQLLRTTQKRAKAGEKPTSGCGTLSGYRVTASNAQVLVYALCDGGSQVIADANATKNFDSDIVFLTSATYEFKVLLGGTVGPATLVLGTNEIHYEIVTDMSGSIDGREV